MKVMSTYPIEYLKVHLTYDEIKTAVRASVLKKTRKAKDYLVASVVVVLLVVLSVHAFLRLTECSNITACANSSTLGAAYVHVSVPDEIFVGFVQ